MTTPKHLRDTAELAENVAAGFRQFRTHLPEHTAEITILISDLFAISASLTVIVDLSVRPERRLNWERIKPDLDRVRSSLEYTLEDIYDAFGQLDARGRASRTSYKNVWTELDLFFNEESGYSLGTRLRKYKMFLKELEDTMNDKFPDLTFMTGLRQSITRLLVAQDYRLASKFGGMSMDDRALSPDSNIAEPSSPVDPRVPGKKRSYERTRPGRRPAGSPDSMPTSPTSSGPSHDIPPFVPDAPGSPTSTSTATQSNESSAVLNDHWAAQVYADGLTVTKLPSGGESSKCLGDMITGIKRWLFQEGFEEVLYIPLEKSSNFFVHFYVRERDARARILCKYRRSRNSDYFCLPLNLLVIVRVGNCLQLCRKRRSGTELVLWANLKFRTFEEMVMFYCTFLALRSQDGGHPVDRIQDYELAGEEEIFGGQILDDGYLHALRIFRDRSTGAVRLQASIHKGEMKRAPVWTAFITHHLRTRAWLRVVEPKIVHVRELHRTVFTSEYNVERGRQGWEVLRFTSRADAESFVEAITDLAGRV